MICEVENDDKKVGYPDVKLSLLIKTVVEAKSKVLSSSVSDKNELYNQLDYLEHELLNLKDKNVELKRDWWS